MVRRSSRHSPVSLSKKAEIHVNGASHPPERQHDRPARRWHKRFYNPDEPSGVPNCGKLCLLGPQRFTRWSNAANFRGAFI